MINILLVDDQELFRQGLRTFLSSRDDIAIVSEASNGIEAIEKAGIYNPDIILMDIEMPALDGVAATRSIIKRGLCCRVILLTVFDHDSYVFEGLRAGAVGYLLKDANAEDVLSAIYATNEGNAWLHPAITAKVLASLTRKQASMPVDANLNERDIEILRLVAQGNTNKQIGNLLNYTEGTIKQYLNTIMNKLQAHDRTHAVVLAQQYGIFE